MTAPLDSPQLRPITLTDIVEAIDAGIRDFRQAPKYGLVLGGLYAAAGWLMIALLWHLGMPYFAYPLAMGFALIAPFAATGFYAVSEHLERGKPLSWAAVLGAVRETSKRELRWMALVSGFALVIWMDIAAFVLFASSNFTMINAESLKNLVTTPTGWMFVILGNAAGAILAFSVFSISAISFPMLYDREVDFVTAMVSSVKLVIASPRAMIGWCIFIAICMVLSLITAFLGLFLAMPVIGHATWHLYRRAVVPVPVTSKPPTDLKLAKV
ncbi:MAG: DUF2189 domain-containing protein [Hyphomicrobium sp.]